MTIKSVDKQMKIKLKHFFNFKLILGVICLYLIITLIYLDMSILQPFVIFFPISIFIAMFLLEEHLSFKNFFFSLLFFNIVFLFIVFIYSGYKEIDTKIEVLTQKQIKTIVDPQFFENDKSVVFLDEEKLSEVMFLDDKTWTHFDRYKNTEVFEYKKETQFKTHIFWIHLNSLMGKNIDDKMISESSLYLYDTRSKKKIITFY